SNRLHALPDFSGLTPVKLIIRQNLLLSGWPLSGTDSSPILLGQMHKTNRLKRFRPLPCLLVMALWFTVAGLTASPFRGAAALADARRAVTFGERPSGSAENRRQRDWILAELKPLGGEVTIDSFTAQTP